MSQGHREPAYVIANQEDSTPESTNGRFELSAYKLGMHYHSDINKNWVLNCKLYRGQEECSFTMFGYGVP